MTWRVPEARRGTTAVGREPVAEGLKQIRTDASQVRMFQMDGPCKMDRLCNRTEVSKLDGLCRHLLIGTLLSSAFVSGTPIAQQQQQLLETGGHAVVYKGSTLQLYCCGHHSAILLSSC